MPEHVVPVGDDHDDGGAVGSKPDTGDSTTEVGGRGGDGRCCVVAQIDERYSHAGDFFDRTLTDQRTAAHDVEERVTVDAAQLALDERRGLLDEVDRHERGKPIRTRYLDDDGSADRISASADRKALGLETADRDRRIARLDDVERRTDQNRSERSGAFRPSLKNGATSK